MTETDTPEIDRTDPGYQRYCIRPDCTAAFNILDVFTGKAPADGWRLAVLFGTVYLCRVHAEPCTTGAHVPRWLSPGAPRGMTGVACSCGWQWPPAEPSNLGQHRDEWVAHLASLDEVAQ